MEFEETATNSTNTENPPTNDTSELVSELDEKSVAYRLRRHCCVVFAVIIFVVVVVLTGVLYYIFGRGKSALAMHHSG